MKCRMLAIAGVVLALAMVAQVATAQTKWAQGIRIVFFPGGPQGGVFAVNVYNGAQAGRGDLGVKVNYVWSDWDPQKMIQQFQEAVATRPDGICIMGHPGDAAFDALIDEARGEGNHRHQQNTTLDKAEAKYEAKRLRLRRRRELLRGSRPGRRSGEALRPEEGRPRHGVGPPLPARARRAHQGRHRCAEGSRAAWWTTSRSTPPRTRTPPPGAPTFAGYVSSHPDVKLVVTDHGGLTATAETYLKAAGKKAGRDQHRRLRPFPRDHCGHQGRLDRPRHRPAGVAPGLPAHPPDLPREGVRVLGPAHQHRGWLR